jgi:hypothetical protein
MHHTEIHPDIMDIIKQKRGGKLHVHDTLDPSRTALVVVDMQEVIEALGVIVS